METAVLSATLSAYVRRAGAVRAAALIDAPTGSEIVEVDGTEELANTLPLPDMRPSPAFPLRATDEGYDLPLLQLAYAAGHVRSVAELLPGSSVLTVEFATSDPGTPLAIAARRGEPLVLLVGDDEFTMAPGWPE